MLDMHRKKWRSRIRGWKDQILKTKAELSISMRSKWPWMQKKPWASRLPAMSSSPSTRQRSSASTRTGALYKVPGA